MRFSALLTAFALALATVSCSEKSPPNDESLALADSAPKTGAKAAAQPKGAPVTSIPKGAQWTILCREIGGAGHVERSRQLKENLVKTSGMRDWHLLHKDDASLLYYGYYKTYSDARAQADRKKIDSMADQRGSRPFRLAHFTPLDAADPDGPPEWNLENAKGHWSLQIAAYKDSPERKQYALDAVKAARQQGIEAYYYHGENMSLVCVGTWPREAVRTADDNVRAGDEGQLKVVLPPLPPGVEAPQIRDKGGRKLHVEAGRNEVVDPTLQAAMARFPDMATNGATMITKRTNPRTGRVDTVADASFPVRIPHDDSSLLDGGETGGIPLPPPPEGAFIDTPSRGIDGSTLRRSTNGS